MSRRRCLATYIELGGEVVRDFRWEDRSQPKRIGRSDSGASLILALVFLIVVSLIVISIAGLTATDLRGSTAFANAQATTAAADGATEVAIQYSRYNFDGATLNYPALCGPTQNINQQTVQAYCETQWHPFSASTRFVTVSTCLSTVTDPVACAMHPLVQAIVVIDDYPPSGNSSCVPGTTQTTSNATCGTEMVQNSWAYNVAPPVVQSITPTTGCTSNPQVTITGTGFTPNSRISFVSSNNYSSNEVFYASQSTSQALASSPSTIIATAPTIAASGSFFVIVTGATGSNQFPTSTTWTC